MATTSTQDLGIHLQNFTDFQRRAAGRNVPWLRKLREDAFARFADVGFPTTRDEDWRFTNIAPIVRTQFRLPGASLVQLPPAELKSWNIEGSPSRLVFVNGRYAPELSRIDALAKGVAVSSLREQIEGNSDQISKQLGHYASTQRDAFVALNTAFVEDGAYVHVKRGVVVESPIHLLFVSSPDHTALMTHPRNLLIFEDQSQGTVVEEYVSLGGGVMLSNSVTELVAGDDAHVSHYMVEREHNEAFNVSTLRIQQGRTANVASHSFLLGGGLVRNNVHPVLAGEGGECLINGLFVGSGKQHLDNYMHVEHASPHCASRQFYNGILDDKAHGVFHGRIVVHKDAQKTDAKQTNRNLLLSDDAQVDTKPQLEIYADDVKCTHGATIGQIDENALFYLRSRGMSEAEARQLLLLAFASECVDRMRPGAAQIYVEQLIQSHLLPLREHSTRTASGSGERIVEEVG
ncbi:MAG TPA: Fe-S cluster assembly protein SufD [Terriglobales bacterium]|nr:Fe-S cluster assembly protein SufD [Terriglobales bacterium]